MGALFDTHHPLLFIIGLLGNITSIVVFLAPIPTFHRIVKKKSTEGFQSFPYVIALLSAMIWLYYAFLNPAALLLVTINVVGCVIETIYLTIYIVYATKQARIFTLRILLLLNFGGFCLLLLVCQILVKGPARVTVLGWVCLTFAVSVFAAPLSIIRVVIRTKSVEFMPFFLSFFLVLSAMSWLLYGLILRNYFIAGPNILGFIFGALQMILYFMYKNNKKGTAVLGDPELPQHRVNDDHDNLKLSSITCEMQEAAVCPQQPGGMRHDQNGAHEEENNRMHVDVDNQNYQHQYSGLGIGEQGNACQV